MPSTLKPTARQHTIFHYAWIIVIVATVVQGVGSAIRMSFGVMVEPLVFSFGWSAGTVGLAYGLMSIISALFAPVAGWMGTRFGARKTMFFGSILFGIGMLMTAKVNSLANFYLSYGIIFGISQSMLLVPVIPAVAGWFRRYIGLATGIMMVSWSLGPALMIQFMAILLEKHGWSNTFIIIGIVGFLLLVFLILIFRDTPEQSGKLAYGILPDDKPLVTTGDKVHRIQKTHENYAYRTNSFWHLINIHFLGCAGHAIILIGIIPLGISRGLSPLTAAGVLSLISVVSISTRFITPILSDFIGSKPVFFVSYLGQGLGVLLLLNASSVFDFYLFAILWAIPYGGEGTSFPVINRQYYGHMPMGTIYGWQLLGAGLGMALGGILPGLTFDMSGNYTIAIYFSSAFSLFGAIIILFLKSTNKSIIPNWPEIEPSKS
jgi:MFS family permease